MKLNRIRKLGLAGALAIGGLLFAPLAASADVNKCAKEISKNGAKVATDVAKELTKCVDGWLKDEDKVLANQAKGKELLNGDDAAKGLNKAAEKCQKSLVKIGVDGIDIATINGTTEKSKLGKAYGKLFGAISGAKVKCGLDPATKLQTSAQLDDEMRQIGFFPPSAAAGMDDIDARLMVMEGFASGWNKVGSLNRDSSRAFQEMGNDRCSLSGVLCDDNTDCAVAHPKGVDTCSPSACPDCIKFARAVDVSTATPTCVDNSPCDGALGAGCAGAPCAGEADCAATGADFCDTAPSAGAPVGPCFMASCQAGDPITSTSVIELEGVLAAAPGVYIYACNDGNPLCTFPSPAVIALSNDVPEMLCDVNEILPNAVGVVGGAGRGITAYVALAVSPVCVDSTGWTGYIDKGTIMPHFNVAACADVDKNVNQSGAPGVDGCAGFAATNCRDEPVDDPTNPGTLLHTGKICQEMVPVGTPAATGHGVLRNDQILTTGVAATPNPCDPTAGVAAGEPSPLILTTHVASGDLWDAGPINTGAPPLGGLIIESGILHVANSASGSPFAAADLAGGALNGAMVSSFSTIATNPAASIGAQITGVRLDCNP